jgi:hypothetical protein
MSQNFTLTEISILNNGGLDISAACSARAKTFLNNVPPTRYTPLNPYPKNTQFQLDMRRKCEILKYAGSGSQQTNSLSKKKQYANLVSNIGTRTIVQNSIEISGSQIITKKINQINTGARGNQYTCTQDRTLPTLTSACDVPGPIQTLIYDPSMNLYNYQNNTRIFSSNLNEYDLLGMSQNN